MNKKFLSVVLFGAMIAGSSVTFTGCIDNDEPAGIENLRGAKAELLRAKVAVEAANAAYVNACATEKLAMAKKEEAIALERQYLAEAQRLTNEIQAARNEEEKARLQAAIEETNAKLEQNKLNWEAELLTSKKNLAEAQKKYEDAMKALELSKTYLSSQELKQLTTVEGYLKTAKAEMETSQGELEKAYDTYKGVVTKPENYLNETTLQEALVDAQTTLEKATNKLAVKKEALAALESNDAYAAWVALKAKYNQKIDSLNAVLADKKTAEAKIIAENHTTIDAATKAIDAARKVKNTEAADKNAEFVYSKSIVAGELDGAKFTGIVSLNTGDNKVVANWTSKKILALAETNEKADNTTDYTKYATLLDNTFAFADGDGTDYKTASDQLDAAIKEVNRAKAAIPTYDTEKAEQNKKDAQTALDNAKKAKTNATTAWTNSIADWNKVVAYTTEAADIKAVEDANTTYTTAMAAANSLADLTEKAKAQVKAQNAFADAIVKYYNAAAPLQLATQKVSIKLTVGSKTTWVTKTVKEWLSDSENKDVYLTELINYFGSAKKLWEKSTKDQTSNDDGSIKEKADAALSTLKTKQEIKDAWKNASNALFGAELGTKNTDEGRITEPTTAEINAVWTKNHSAAGACGAVLTAEEALKTATENVGKAAEFDKIVAQLTAWKTVMSDAKTAYMTKNKTTLDAVTAAQKAVTDKVATPIKALKMDATEAMTTEIKAVITAIDGTEIKEYEAVIKDLKDEIGDKKGVPSTTTTTSTGLNKQVETASDNVLEAEKMIELFKAGNLKEQYVIQWAQETLDLAKADYATKVETFNYWNGKLADLMKTLYGQAAE